MSRLNWNMFYINKGGGEKGWSCPILSKSAENVFRSRTRDWLHLTLYFGLASLSASFSLYFCQKLHPTVCIYLNAFRLATRCTLRPSDLRCSSLSDSQPAKAIAEAPTLRTATGSSMWLSCCDKRAVMQNRKVTRSRCIRHCMICCRNKQNRTLESSMSVYHTTSPEKYLFSL